MCRAEKVGSLVNPVCRNSVPGAARASIPLALLRTRWDTSPLTQTRNIFQAGIGALTNLGRNTFRSPFLNVWNMAAFKNSKVGERLVLQFRVQAFNVFNHPNFTIGNLSVVPATANALNPAYTTLTSVPSGSFLNEHLFNSGSRRIELGLKLSY